MKKLIFALAMLCFSFTAFADFGSWASAVSLGVNGTTSFYNTTAPGDPNNFGSLTFTGTNLGSFTANSGGLTLNGGGLKTWKNSGGNVCSATLNYRVYQTGTTAPAFTAITLSWTADLTNPGDQLWQNTGANVDLTAYTAGSYTLDVYYSFTGDPTTATCNSTRYDNNNGTNYTATFTITSAMPVAFGSLQAIINNNVLSVNWSTEKETNNDHFDVMASDDGINFNKIGEVKSKAANGNSDTVLNYDFSKSLGATSALFGIAVLGMGLILVSFRRRSKLMMLAAIAMLASVMIYGCSKSDSSPVNNNKKIFVKIIQVDRDGGVKGSKTIVATNE